MKSYEKVFIGNLPRNTNNQDLQSFFKGYEVMRFHKISNKSAFAEFNDFKNAEKAINDLNGKYLQGRPILVEMARK